MLDHREREASLKRARERHAKAQADPDRMLSAEEARDETEARSSP